MIPILAECEAHDTGGHSGTAAVAIAFLTIFSVLIAFDAAASVYGIFSSLSNTHSKVDDGL
jgi:hypothetical protein